MRGFTAMMAIDLLKCFAKGGRWLVVDALRFPMTWLAAAHVIDSCDRPLRVSHCHWHDGAKGKSA